MTDENFDTLFDDDDMFSGEQGGGSSDAPVEGVRSMEDFRALVEYHIAVMTSTKNSDRVRVESAYWLGESGEIDAIRPLIAVYKRDKKHPKVQNAAKYSLGMFKALDAAISRESHEMIEDALERPENADLYQTLTDIAIFDKRGKRGSSGKAIRRIIMLSALLGVFLAGYILLPEGSLTQALTPPTPTPSPTIDPNAPTATPTFTPSLTPEDTLTPSATPGIAPEESRRIQADLLTLIGRSVTTRDFLDSLTTVWTTVANSPNQATIEAVCNTPTATIPPDYVLPEGYAELDPLLKQTTDYVNLGLALTRSGWAYFRDSCAQGVQTMTAERIEAGLATVRNAQDIFNEANILITYGE